MLQNLEDTASELIHYRARTIIEENRGKHKIAHTAFNPRLGKEAKKVVFPGRTAQDLVINPTTGGYDLTNCNFFIISSNMEVENTEKKTDNTNTNMNTQQNTSNLSLKTDKEKSQTVTTPGNKKKEKGKKGPGKKRRKNKNNKTDEPPKKKPKISEEKTKDIRRK